MSQINEDIKERMRAWVNERSKDKRRKKAQTEKGRKSEGTRLSAGWQEKSDASNTESTNYWGPRSVNLLGDS